MDNVIEQRVNIIYNKYINTKETNGKFVCPHEGCGKKYQTEDSLTRHLNRHSTVKEHVCDFCGKAFLRKSECVIHMRIHTGEKPFECSICNKKFARATDLRIHTIYHSDEKPFACPFPGCSLRFKRKSDAKKHLRVHVRKTQGNIIDAMTVPKSAFRPIPKERLIVDHSILCFVDN